MFRNYLVTALNNLLKHRLFTLINLLVSPSVWLARWLKRLVFSEEFDADTCFCNTELSYV